jgi:hypothetical protein
MTRRRIATALAVLMGFAALPAISAAAPLTPTNQYQLEGFFSFCNEAQKTTASINDAALISEGVTINTSIYTDFTDFAFSKSGVAVTSAKKILPTSFVQYSDPESTDLYQIRCKLRTAESLSAGAWPPGSPNNSGRFALEPYFGFGPTVGGALTSATTDLPCSTVNQQTIDRVWASLSPAQQDAAPYNPTATATSGAAANTLVTVPDTVTGDGPTWTQDFPSAVLDGSTLEIPSKGLTVATGTSGAPRFEGAFYCTFIAPDFLRDILLGTAVPA